MIIGILIPGEKKIERMFFSTYHYHVIQHVIDGTNCLAVTKSKIVKFSVNGG